MTDEEVLASALGHPLRDRLMELIREHGTLTSNQAARLLGESSGACSFHLRQLAKAGHVEEAPSVNRRAKPWRIASTEPAEFPSATGEFGILARDLEDEGYRRWLAERDKAPSEWRRDEAFSTVLQLTPDELTAVSAQIKQVLAPYARRASAPADAAAVAVVARLFPL